MLDNSTWYAAQRSAKDIDFLLTECEDGLWPDDVVTLKAALFVLRSIAKEN